MFTLKIPKNLVKLVSLMIAASFLFSSGLSAKPEREQKMKWIAHIIKADIDDSICVFCNEKALSDINKGAKENPITISECKDRLLSVEVWELISNGYFNTFSEHELEFLSMRADMRRENPNYNKLSEKEQNVIREEYFAEILAGKQLDEKFPKRAKEFSERITGLLFLAVTGKEKKILHQLRKSK